MALINCPECKKETSDTSQACHHCGFDPTPAWKRRALVSPVSTFAMAAFSLVLSLTALIVVQIRDPLGAGMDKYDFSTPKAALFSRMKMELNQDIRAELELQSRTKNKKRKEAIATMEVRKEAEFQGKKILFVTFKEDGVNKYDTKAFEKDAETGFWIHTYVSSHNVEKDNEELYKQLKRWEVAGELSSK